MFFDDPWGFLASNIDSKLKSEKSSFSSVVVFSKFGFAPFPASPGALLLHALIKMLEVSGKTSKGPDSRPEI